MHWYFQEQLGHSYRQHNGKVLQTKLVFVKILFFSKANKDAANNKEP